jgi:quinol monooxygenase YgiN
MHVILRRYAGAASQLEEAARRVQAGLVPMLKGHAGFLGYAAFASEQGDLVSCSVYEDAAAAQRSYDEVRGWAQANLAPILSGAQPQVSSGDVMDHALAQPQSGGAGQSLYCMVREFEGVPAEQEFRPIAERVIANYRKADGFRGLYVVRDPQDASRLLSVLYCDGRQHAERMFGEIAQAAMPQGMTQRVLASGQTSVLAMA